MGGVVLDQISSQEQVKGKMAMDEFDLIQEAVCNWGESCRPLSQSYLP